MHENLIREWAKVEGFGKFAEDHHAVLRNLAKWLDRRSNGVANNKFDLTTPTDCVHAFGCPNFHNGQPSF